MREFGPTIHVIDPPGPPDPLGEAVLHSLVGRLRRPRTWGPFKTLLLAAATFGLWPLLAWGRRFRDFAVTEHTQLWHVAEWVRLRTGHAQGDALQEMAERVRFNPAIRLLSLGLGVGVAMALLIAMDWRGGMGSLMSATYGYVWRVSGSSSGRARLLFTLWALGLSLAYALHWIAVQQYVIRVRRFIELLNTIARSQNVDPVWMPPVETGVRPMWLLAGVILLTLGAFWAVPLMLAGALQRRYINRSSQRMRIVLAHRIRALLAKEQDHS